jgi:hypothetical protein
MRIALNSLWVLTVWLWVARADAQWDVISGNSSLPGCRSLLCIDDSTCVRSFEPQGSLSQVLAITRTAGETWRTMQVAQSFVRPVGPFYFRSARLGWAVATGGSANDTATILRTVDGVNFQPPDSFAVVGQIAPPTQDGASGISALFMVSATLGYAAGTTLDQGTSRPFLAYTTDGGANWVERTANEIAVLTNTRVLALYFLDENVGLISFAGDGVSSGIFRTEDGGMTFSEASFGDGGGPDTLANPVIQFAFRDDKRGYALTAFTAQPGGFAVTNDGGATWDARTVDTDNAGNPLQLRAYEMAFTDATHGFIVGGDNGAAAQILRTEDGGDSWSIDELPSGWGSLTVPVQCAGASSGGVEYAMGSGEARVLRRGMAPEVDLDGGVGLFDAGVGPLADAGSEPPDQGSTGGSGAVSGGGSGVPAPVKDDGKCSLNPGASSAWTRATLGALALVLAQRTRARRMAPRRTRE